MKLFLFILILLIPLIGLSEEIFSDEIAPNASGDKPFEKQVFYCGQSLQNPFQILFVDDNPNLESILYDNPVKLNFYPHSEYGEQHLKAKIELENYAISHHPENNRTHPYLVKCDTGSGYNFIPSKVKGEFHAVLDYSRHLGPESIQLKNYGYCKILDSTPPGFEYFIEDSRGKRLCDAVQITGTPENIQEYQDISVGFPLNEKTRYTLNIVFRDNVEYFYDGSENPSDVKKMQLIPVTDNHIYFAGVKPGKKTSELFNYDEYDRYENTAKKKGYKSVKIQFTVSSAGEFPIAIMIEDMASIISPCSLQNNVGYYNLIFQVKDIRMNY